jgi:hypothetical protein
MSENPITNWLDEELKNVKSTAFSGEKLEALKLKENIITEITIDASAPFAKWTSEEGTTKAIIPVTFAGIKYNFWLNLKNPVYHQLLEKVKAGALTIKILQTGNQKNTRYAIVS